MNLLGQQPEKCAEDAKKSTENLGVVKILQLVFMILGRRGSCWVWITEDACTFVVVQLNQAFLLVLICVVVIDGL